MLKTVLGITGTDSDTLLQTYLDVAKREILAWRYSYAMADVFDVPVEYETTQVMAVVTGFSIRGAEGQTVHNENGISRTFQYADMVAYIRANVIPKAKSLRMEAVSNG
jgi:hypothetical protein